MGKLIALVVLLVAGFAIYWFNFHQSSAYKAYLNWTDAVHTGNCSVLQGMAEAQAKEWADNFCTPQGGMQVMGQTVPGRSAAQMVQDLASTPQGAMRVFRHEKVSEEAHGDAVTLVVLEDAGGRPSNFSKPAPPVRQTLVMHAVGELWKVSEYKEVAEP